MFIKWSTFQLCSHLPARRASCDRPPSAFAWKPAIHQIDPAWQLTGNKKNRQNTPPKTNMSHKRGLFEYEIHLPTIDFQGTCLFSRKYVKYRSHVEELANVNMIPVVKFYLLHCLIFRIRCFNCKNAGLSSAQKWHTHTHFECVLQENLLRISMFGGAINLHGL